MGYQDRLEAAEAEAAIASQYITEHEDLADIEAFWAAPDMSADTLSAVWRIVQTRPATQCDEAVADIRSACLDLIGYHAKRYAQMVMDRGQV